MTKILIVSVGGSFQPIVTSIRSLQPDRVVFVASDGEKGSKSQVIGEGTPCEIRRGIEVLERLPNIPTIVGLGENFQRDRDLVLVENPDDLAECYIQIRGCVENLQRDTSNQLMVDYTGGTKTLSASMVLAAVDCQIPLYITIAARNNLIKVDKGEATQLVDTSFRQGKFRI